MDLINQFIENYKKKLTFYENLGRISSSQLEDALQSAGIRAMVTYRIKNPGRLKVRYCAEMSSARFPIRT